MSLEGCQIKVVIMLKAMAFVNLSTKNSNHGRESVRRSQNVSWELKKVVIGRYFFLTWVEPYLVFLLSWISSITTFLSSATWLNNEAEHYDLATFSNIPRNEKFKFDGKRRLIRHETSIALYIILPLNMHVRTLE